MSKKKFIKFVVTYFLIGFAVLMIIPIEALFITGAIFFAGSCAIQIYYNKNFLNNE